MILSIKDYIRYNLKIAFNYNLMSAAAVVLLSFIIFSYTYLNYDEMARIGEMCLSITGIILFTSIGNIEERENIQESIYTRKIPHVLALVTRLSTAALLCFGLIYPEVLYGKYMGGSFSVIEMTAGIWISAVYLGMVGFAVCVFSGSMTAGYLVSFGYFIFEFMTKGKYTKDLFVLSLLKHSFHEKYLVLLAAVVLVTISLVYIYKKS